MSPLLNRLAEPRGWWGGMTSEGKEGQTTETRGREVGRGGGREEEGGFHAVTMSKMTMIRAPSRDAHSMNRTPLVTHVYDSEH